MSTACVLLVACPKIQTPCRSETSTVRRHISEDVHCLCSARSLPEDTDTMLLRNVNCTTSHFGGCNFRSDRSAGKPACCNAHFKASQLHAITACLFNIVPSLRVCRLSSASIANVSTCDPSVLRADGCINLWRRSSI
jgi:hypothetical protein